MKRFRQTLSPEAATVLPAEHTTHCIKDDNLILQALRTFIVKNELVDDDIIKEGSALSFNWQPLDANIFLQDL